MAISAQNETRVIGYVVVGNGTTTKTRFLPGHKGPANRIRRNWIARFGYTGPIVTVLSDGTLASLASESAAIATAKTYFAGLGKRQLQTFGVNAVRRVKLQAALP